MDLAPYHKRVEARLGSYLAKAHLSASQLTQVMQYSVLSGGKRLRPILTYLTALACAKQSEKDQVLSLADSSACTIELIHIYSLIHDDLPSMDDDDTRHHKPSCHIVYGQALAILAGDGLQSLAFKILSEDEKLSSKQILKAIQTLATQAFNMVYGQTLDIETDDKKINLAQLKKIHQHKTAALLQAAVLLGGIAVDADEKTLKGLAKFALNFGLAYQIQDDVLDVKTPSKLLGKNANSDAHNNKITYANLLGTSAASELFNKYYQESQKYLKNININHQDLLNLVSYLRNRHY